MRPTDGAHLPVGATLNGIVVREDVMERLPAEDLDRLERLVMDMAPGPRRALLALAWLTDPEERAFAAKALGRAGLRTHERVLDARHHRTTAEDERLAKSLGETAGYYDIFRDADGDITLGGERPATDQEDEP
ncbi:hypothetical protein J2847_002991 [Azospirillum agricola]|uniref:hypothetical protein n=1 Tax=Azospirillum agricola TaxID=1720247 RepID=UPI001AE4C60A|nr:hypothetical protein [Azospirillum agricola]MBP2229692.1 hypothetical protein [Azospirillum agricola]